MNGISDSEAIATALTPDHPYPGLLPFGERDQAFFHGRDAEQVELFRLVRSKVLTVLFGQSGLGKTSLLQAALFPRLRGKRRRCRSPCGSISLPPRRT